MHSKQSKNLYSSHSDLTVIRENLHSTVPHYYSVTKYFLLFLFLPCLIYLMLTVNYMEMRPYAKEKKIKQLPPQKKQMNQTLTQDSKPTNLEKKLAKMRDRYMYSQVREKIYSSDNLNSNDDISRPSQVSFCLPNHKPHKSILVKFEFFYTKMH